MTDEIEDDVLSVFTDEDVALMKDIARVSREIVDHFLGLPRPLTEQQRADLDRFIASQRELIVGLRFLLADSPGEAVRAALGDLPPPSGATQ
jgi:hypothetical protein